MLHEVEAGGFLWRIHSIDMTKIPTAPSIWAFGELAHSDKDAAVRSLMADPDLIVRTLRAYSEALCMAVVAIGRAGEEWEPLELVLEREDEDASAGRMWAESLPEDTAMQLFHHVAVHSETAAAADA